MYRKISLFKNTYKEISILKSQSNESEILKVLVGSSKNRYSLRPPCEFTNAEFLGLVVPVLILSLAGLDTRYRSRVVFSAVLGLQPDSEANENVHHSLRLA